MTGRSRPQPVTWISLAEAAERIGVSRNRLRQAVHATDHTHLPARLHGNRWLVRVDDVDGWPERAFPAA